MANTYNTTISNSQTEIGGIPFTRPFGIDPQDVPWLTDLIARQSLRLFDARKLHDLSPSVCFGPNAAIHTAHLPLQPNSDQTTLVALKQHHRHADLVSEVHLLLTTPASQYTNPILGIAQLGDHGLTCIVLPYHPLGNLRQYIADQRSNLKPLSQMQIIHDIASGLEFLHQRGIQHMNLHSANVLISLQGMAILTDFGRPNNRVEVGMPPKPTAEQERVRSLAAVFLAPEVLASNQYSSQSEVYALGMVMFELLTGRVAFHKDLDQPGLSNRIMFGRKDEIPANIKGSPGADYEALIKDCWELDPVKRPHLSQVKSRLEQLMNECRQKNDALKALQLQKQQQYQQQQQAQYMQPYQPGSAAPPTPPLPELPPIINTIQSQKDVPALTMNVITTHIIVADTPRIGPDGSSTTISTKQLEVPAGMQSKPIEAWTIGQATVSTTAQRRDTIPISTRLLDISLTQNRAKQQPNKPNAISMLSLSSDTSQSVSPISPTPVQAIPSVSSVSSRAESEISYNNSSGSTWPLPPGMSTIPKQEALSHYHTPSMSPPAPTSTLATVGASTSSSHNTDVNNEPDNVVRAYAMTPESTNESASTTTTAPGHVDSNLAATPIAARMIATAASAIATQASTMPPTPTSVSPGLTHYSSSDRLSDNEHQDRKSALVIPLFPEPPSTLHNRRISNIDPRFRHPLHLNFSGTQEHERGHSSDDSVSRGPISPLRTMNGAAMAPQEPGVGASATAGLTARAAYVPITSSGDVPTASPSNTIHAAAKNGDLLELQQFLNRALSRSLSNGSSTSTGNLSSGHNSRGSAAMVLDECEPIERLTVLCCAAVARKNKYQALNMILKAGANVQCKEQRGGNTPLHLICETASPPPVDPMMTRIKQDESGDRARSRSEMDLLNPYASQMTLPDLVPADDESENDDSEESQEKVLKQMDEHDDQEQQALDRVKEDSESTFSLLTTDEGVQTITVRQQSNVGGAYYQMKSQILVKGGLEDQIRLLVLAGSPIDTPNHRGETPLLLLLRFHDSVTALATLLKLGADPTLMAPFGPGTDPVEIHIDPKTLLNAASQKRLSKNIFAALKQGTNGQQSPTGLSSTQSTGPYNQSIANDNPNHILVMHGGSLAHAAYYLRINCVRYLLDHEIECSDPAIIEQAIVACHHSVAARVNPPLVEIQNKILKILKHDWKGEAGRKRRYRVAERTLNKKNKSVRSNVLLVALAVSANSASSASESSSSSASRDFSLQGSGVPPVWSHHGNHDKLSSSLGPIPTTHFYATEGPMGTEIELVSHYGFQTEPVPTTTAVGVGQVRYQLTDQVISPIPTPIMTTGLGQDDQQQQQQTMQDGIHLTREYQDWHGSNGVKGSRDGQSPGAEVKGILRKIKIIKGRRS
ncbi:hypothetical protein FBU30_002399 [Linnemannia zychae]|nr:hypothetical protein FBU30_002399 [Linnemannia zychae]